MGLKSINISSSSINKFFGQLPFRSEKIAKIFEVLSLGKAMLAKELASIIGVPSKQILPRLKRYIQRGWVQVQKINNLNVYSISETAKKILQLQGSFEKVKENAEHLLGRKLDEDEIEILKFFYELKGYIEKSENETIAEQVYHTLKKRIPLSRITEILTEFTKARILFAFRLRTGVILKVRLNKNLLL
ncbi:MAG: conjugal transfer protein [Nitrososphaeria archaeon]